MTVDQLARNFPIESAWVHYPVTFAWAERMANVLFARLGGYEHLDRVLAFVRTATSHPDRYLVDMRQHMIVALIIDMAADYAY